MASRRPVRIADFEEELGPAPTPRHAQGREDKAGSIFGRQLPKCVGPAPSLVARDTPERRMKRANMLQRVLPLKPSTKWKSTCRGQPDSRCRARLPWGNELVSLQRKHPGRKPSNLPWRLIHPGEERFWLLSSPAESPFYR